MKKISIFFASLVPSIFSLLGCHPSSAPQTQTQIWTAGQGTVPAVFASEQFSEPERSVLVKDEVVKFVPQRWGVARVEGGFLQKIEDPQGKMLFGKTQYRLSPEKDLSISKARLERMAENRYKFLEDFKSRWPGPKLEILAGPEIVILSDRKKPSAAYTFDALMDQHQVVRFWVSALGGVIKKEKVSHDDFDTPAWLYSVHQVENLEEIFLRGLKDDTTSLATSSHVVRSQAAVPLSPHNAPWKFPQDDPRFDQLQAFYYVQQAIGFFHQNFGFKAPMMVTVETSVGYPDRTNAAFTYQNQIRLGSGDGKTYRTLAQDPSVVFHEMGHVLINSVARLPAQGEGGSMAEGFADYFAATSLNEPKLGRYAYMLAPQLRNLDDELDYGDRNGGLYHDSLIVSGTLWELRKKFSVEMANRLAMKTLSRLGPSEKLAEFGQTLRMVAGENLSAPEQKVFEEIMERRQWPR